MFVAVLAVLTNVLYVNRVIDCLMSSYLLYQC